MTVPTPPRATLRKNAMRRSLTFCFSNRLDVVAVRTSRLRAVRGPYAMVENTWGYALLNWSLRNETAILRRNPQTSRFDRCLGFNFDQHFGDCQTRYADQSAGGQR